MKDLVLSKDQLDRYKKILVESIEKFVDTTGTKGAVFGLSGGVDSALVAVLGKMALKDKLKALVIPETGVSKREDVKDALSLAKELGIPHRVIELRWVLNSVRAAYPELKDPKRVLSRANLAPRMRMVFNYAVSNMEDLIVLGTGNKSELLLGYFTKYGDGGADFLPIGDLYKTQVRQLAQHLSIPNSIVNKPPSAGLWHGQTDEDELGESYENIDKVLFNLYDMDLSIEKASANLGLDIQTVERIDELVKKNAHKRKTPQIVELS
jgi:NAD+ synthase